MPLIGSEWSSFDSDIDKKMVAIFSWMPQTIMSIKHSKNEMKFQKYSLKDVSKLIAKSKDAYDKVKTLKLLEADISQYENEIKIIVSTMAPAMGTVAVSKYLHFSAPEFFPMWDRQLRLGKKLTDDAEGFIQYMKSFKKDLAETKNKKSALAKYPANVIRGWDIVLMKNR